MSMIEPFQTVSLIRSSPSFGEDPVPDFAEASEVLENAHDVLLRTGVQCGTGTHMDNSIDQPNCLWEAIAIAAGSLHTGSVPTLANWRGMLKDVEYRSTPLGAALYWVGMQAWTPVWNDVKAKPDDVFDLLKNKAKRCRDIEAVWEGSQ